MNTYHSIDDWKNAVTKAWEAIDTKAIGYLTFETLDSSLASPLLIAHYHMADIQYSAGLYDTGKGTIYNEKGEPIVS